MSVLAVIKVFRFFIGILIAKEIPIKVNKTLIEVL